jgi:energy-coupling factor transporter ATP-binding protein EcfA2
MITIRGLTYTYPEGNYPVLKDIDLDVEQGEFVLLVGATGSGKSTFLYCLNGLIPNVLSGDLVGYIKVNGLSPQESSVAEMSRIVGTVFQNPESQIFMLKVEDDVAFGCENLLMPREESIRRRDIALKDMGLMDARYADTQNLSGGMKQRLAIGSIYAMGPKVFLFDEPTTDLDSKGRGEFLSIVKKLKGEGNTILLAEHQYEDFLSIAERIIVFENGKISNGSFDLKKMLLYKEKISYRKHQCKIDTQTAVPVQRIFFREGSEPYKYLQVQETEHPPANAPIIDIKELTFSYTNKKPVLEDINLEINKGELIAVCGDNGSGKSTLLKIMAGILRPDKGKISFFGCVNPAIEELIGKVGFLFQNPDEQLFANSVEEEIIFGPLQLKKNVDKEQYLKFADFDSLKNRHPQTLSRGQRQLLAILSVLAIEPSILILDEPTTGLDYDNLCILFRIISMLTDEEKTIIFSTHNMNVKRLADRVILLKNNRIASDEIYK